MCMYVGKSRPETIGKLEKWSMPVWLVAIEMDSPAELEATVEELYELLKPLPAMQCCLDLII